MDMDSAAVFLAGSILYALAGVAILIAVVFSNNIIHKYWKSFGWKLMSWNYPESPRFITEEELHAQKETGKKV